MPTTASVYNQTALTNIAMAYRNGDYVAERLLPTVTVQQQGGKYWIFDAAKAGFAASTDHREAGGEANVVDYAVTSGTYFCEGHALKHYIPAEEYANSESPLRPEADTVEFLTDKMMVMQDIDLKDKLDNGSIGASDPTNEWDDTANGDPFADIKLATDTIEDAIGYRPNKMWMDSKVWRVAKVHPDIVDRVKYGGTNTTPGDVSTAGFAALFDIDDVIVVNTMKNTAVQGQTASVSRIWGSDVYLAYIPRNPGMKIPSLGYRFVWQGLGPTKGFKVRRWFDEDRESNVIQVQKYYDQKVTMAAACYRLQNRLT